MTANYDLVLDQGWKFHLGDVKRFGRLNHETYYQGSKAGGELGNLDIFRKENAWQDIAMPHDWLSFLPVDQSAAPSGGYKERGVGWYQVEFELPKDRIECAQLVFDGVLGQCVVYVNGTIAVRNFSGYNRFMCDVEDYLLPGSVNTIAVYVDARTWEGWWYEGAGIYRPVTIRFRSKIHLNREGCFVRGELADGKWKIKGDFQVCGLESVDIEASFAGPKDTKDSVQIHVLLRDPSGKILLTEAENAVVGTEPEEEKAAAEPLTNWQCAVQEPVLWSPETPALYRLECRLMQGETCLDRMNFEVGFRDIQWIPQKGMFLNGEHYTVKGICCHQDHAGVGAAVPAELLEYRIRRLKEFGINAYRCAHHAPGEDLLRICDRLGMLVMSENRHFSVSEDTLRELRAMVQISRNHPSVFLYSLFNEEPWQGEERGLRISAGMKRCVKELDDTRPVTAAVSAGVLSEYNATDVQDVIGLNYQLEDYDACHARIPDRVLLGTENCPTFGTRGNYEDREEDHIFACYGDKFAWFAQSIAQTMEYVEERSYVAGCFPWSGFDYRGEPAPYEWPSVLSHWGITDHCGFAKDTAYYLKAWFDEELTVHLFPHWNWTEGEMVRVCAFTNGETAQLTINGKPLEEKKVEKKRVEWMVPYEAGQISVRVRRGEEEAISVVRTAGKPAKILMTNEASAWEQDRNKSKTVDDSAAGLEQIYVINLTVTDEAGVLIPDYEETVIFDVPEHTILGVGNGNPNGHQPDIADRVPFFHGKAQLIVKGRNGRITAKSKELTAQILL